MRESLKRESEQAQLNTDALYINLISLYDSPARHMLDICPDFQVTSIHAAVPVVLKNQAETRTNCLEADLEHRTQEPVENIKHQEMGKIYGFFHGRTIWKDMERYGKI